MTLGIGSPREAAYKLCLNKYDKDGSAAQRADGLSCCTPRNIGMSSFGHRRHAGRAHQRHAE